MAVKNLRLALLICDTPVPVVVGKYGTYLEIYREYLSKSLAASDRASVTEFTLEGYDVVRMQYPKMEDFTGPNPFDGIVITGSAATAQGPEDWIKTLIGNIRTWMKEIPQVKIIGICFGHQIVAQAMGGQCVRNEKGWEIGTTPVQLTEVGRQIFGANLTDIQIQQMHRDHVPELPPSAELLASSPIAPVQGIISRYASGGIHVLSVQGHPEFSPDIVSKIIDVRESSGILDAETIKEARIKAAKRDDGIGLIGQAIWQVLSPS
ncbi:hypothetical protein FRB94_012872 [Tulasnella sp. JGI-2019a]|nr:hypothetical protein FRB94_012872 [Tulasnella sp. JGI-2019a]KAG8997095.1 hypothetical protein FRB93_000498 [Tulasnella sp. JGI-2019a]